LQVAGFGALALSFAAGGGLSQGPASRAARSSSASARGGSGAVWGVSRAPSAIAPNDRRLLLRSTFRWPVGRPLVISNHRFAFIHPPPRRCCANSRWRWAGIFICVICRFCRRRRLRNGLANSMQVTRGSWIAPRRERSASSRRLPPAMASSRLPRHFKSSAAVRRIVFKSANAKPARG
jgi:hypothetical protein